MRCVTPLELLIPPSPIESVLPVMENPIAPIGNCIERMLQGKSTTESGCPGPSIITFPEPSLAGGPMGNQLSAVDHLLSRRLAPLQISPACVDGARPAPNRSRHAPRANCRLHTLPAVIN